MSDEQPRPAVFLDRDGTLIEERGYPACEEDILPLPGVGLALQRLGEAGFLRIVLTNQSGVARGLYTEEDLGRLHADMARKLAAQGGAIDAIYYCPHHPEGSAVAYAFACACRKPGSGLLDMALAEHAIDLPRSVFIGDGVRDLYPEAGPVRARILLRSGHPLPADAQADHIAKDLGQAVEWLLARP
ncbi:MAG TPA: HAD-IIIA family hydrolase [Planctomycetota bacterium]|nr:HAD-IIIA family hydrolase [Planctomycetota bacterium]